MSDAHCAHCREPWEVYGLRHEGWDYITEDQAESLNVGDAFLQASAGDRSAKRQVSETVYKAVLGGRGCPSETCGFIHDREGAFRTEQIAQMVFGDAVDDDPFEHL